MPFKRIVSACGCRFRTKRWMPSLPQRLRGAKLENWLWFAGMVLTGIWLLTGNCIQKRKLKALPDSRDAALLAELEAVKVLGRRE